MVYRLAVNDAEASSVEFSPCELLVSGTVLSPMKNTGGC
jgi:hypothetical protein